MSTTLQEAKERVRIFDLWREFGFDGEPKKQCRCPFHEDRSPSFSVFDDGRGWKCFSGCGEGSVIDFYAKAKGVSDDEACKEILRMAGTSSIVEPRRTVPKRSHDVLELPPLVSCSKEISQCVADSRGLSIAAVDFASAWLKTVVFGRVCDQDCWILTDASRRSAEARRIDRKAFPAVGALSERKSHSLRHSSKSWPVGILPPGFEEPWLRKHVHKILLVEGGPDYLAACQLIAAHDENILPVAMLGASSAISKDALPYFRNRNVTVIAHADEAGHTAAIRWAQQITDAQGSARVVEVGSDLNEAVSTGGLKDAGELFS
jgi:hypothetical protein